jgi:muramidase (phage lysozyme)
MTRDDLREIVDDKNVQAFLKVIRSGEGTSDELGYRRMFGGDIFDSFKDHPRQLHTRKTAHGPLASTAAGAYQFLARTWDGLVKQYGFEDFSPANQDEGAVALIAGREAIGDVIEGRFNEAVRKCRLEWASLPGSPYGQPTKTFTQALEAYTAAGGQIAAA